MSLGHLAFLANFQGQIQRADRLATASLTAFREIGAPRALAEALLRGAFAAQVRGQSKEAESLAAEGLAHYRRTSDSGRVAEALFTLGTTLLQSGRLADAADALGESLALRLERGDIRTAAATQGALGAVRLNQGRLQEARQLMEESLELCLRHGSRLGEGITIAMLGHLSIAEGDANLARDWFQQAVARFEDIGNPVYLPWCLEGLAELAALEGRWEEVASLAGSRSASPLSFGASLGHLYVEAYENALAKSRDALGEERFAAAHAAGRERTIAETLRAIPRNVS